MMTAVSGGGRPSGIPNPLSSANERPDADQPRHRDESRPRPLDQIFPMQDDANRTREMQSAWRSFCRDRLEAVRGVLDAGRSPPESAYQLGELLHNHFRTRGVTLTSYELRGLVAELLSLHEPGDERHEPAPPAVVPIVAFEREPKEPWPGDEPQAPSPAVAEKALEPPPSPIVKVVPRETARMGLIERLWADRSIQAIFVNGAQSVFVERGGSLHAVKEVFRDEAHLNELAGRLVGRPDSGMADFQLCDGTTGFVILPPHAPSGPVLTMRRADPGRATLDKLVAEGAVDRPVAELLRLGMRGRLNMLVTGPHHCGKTALLVALVRDLEPSVRVVTVARHRHFAWPMASKVELVAAAPVSIAKLIPSAARLEPGLLVMDDVALQDVAALAERLLRGAPGTLAALGPEAMSDALTRSVDLVARIDRGSDGVFRVVTVEDSAGAMIFRRENGKLVRGATAPAFASTLQVRGEGLALGKLLAQQGDCDRPPHTDRPRKPVTTNSYIWY